MTNPISVPISASQASSDAALIALWLHGRPATTTRAYTREIERFFVSIGVSLRETTLGDVQAFADELVIVGLSSASQGRALVAVKSLIAFAHQLGYVPFDVGRPVKIPSSRDRPAERILSEAAVQRIIALEDDPRNAVLLRLLYAGGLRVSEMADLTWRDVQDRDNGGQVTVHGKGAKTRAVVLPVSVWRDLVALRGSVDDLDAPVFLSRQGGSLTACQTHRVVSAAAARAGIVGDVSPHWLRHAHASHALDRGAPVHLVKETLGHASLATTSRYTHARPGESSGKYLAV